MKKEETLRKKQLLLEWMNDPDYRPMRIRELAALLHIPREERDQLREWLDALSEEGKIRCSKRGRYEKTEETMYTGAFLANAKGFGFVRIEGRKEDIFIPRGDVHGAMHGDTVRIRVKQSRKRGGDRAEGSVLEVLERANLRVVGYYRRVNQGGIVLPDNPRLPDAICIAAGKMMGAVTGCKVVAEITKFPGKGSAGRLSGRVIECLGRVGDPGTDILSIVRSFDLPEEFPQEVTQEAEALSASVPVTAGDSRRDFTSLYTITIDGEDAKDLDDAISIETLPNQNVRLGVHIADVSAYVGEGSQIDREARKRGTSVYLADRVIPMLPHALCNGSCSLNEGEERLTLSCLMEIDGSGVIVSHEICESVIHSNRRLTYGWVHAMLSGEAVPVAGEETELCVLLRCMNETAKRLRKRRRERGSIDFDFPESKVILNRAGKPVDICAYERNEATRMIEDFMLAANETVAEEYRWRQIPFLYRVHEPPDPEKMKALSVFIHSFGLTMKTKNGVLHPKELQRLLGKLEGNEAESLISRIMLCSMKQARYDAVCSGHFGLASPCYTHFTSPIRRYPDLQIHRIIKETLHGEMDERRIGHFSEILPDVAAESSRLERRAEEAERESVKYKQCEYMEAHIGERYEGIISGVTRFGLYVELSNTVEGMIRMQELRDDYYRYDEEHWMLVGEMTGRTYRLGQGMQVRVARADRLARTVDFVPVREGAKEG